MGNLLIGALLIFLILALLRQAIKSPGIRRVWSSGWAGWSKPRGLAWSSSSLH